MIARKGLLYAVLSHVVRTIDRHSSMPALHHVKLESDGDTLRIEATDLTTHIVASIPCQGRVRACLPARALCDFVKPDDIKDRQSLVELLPEEGEKITVAVDAAMTTMSSLPVADFPRRPGDKLAPKSWTTVGTWRAADIVEALGWVSLACGTDETRRHLTGVLFEKDHVVGLDGHRLHLAKINGLDGGATLLPSKSIAAMIRIAPKSGDIIATRSKDVVRFAFATGNVTWEIETRVMEDKFPPYEQVIPKNEQYTAEVDRDAFLRAITRMPRSKTNRSHSVRMVVNGAIRLERHGDEGTMSTTLPILRTTHTGPDSIIGVNASYLADAFSSGAEVVTARFGGELDPLRFDIGDRVAVVMPMRQ